MHCTSCTTHNNTYLATNYNSSFLCRKAHTREKLAFWKGMVGKKRWKFVAKKGKKKLNKSVEIVESAKTSILSFSNMAGYSQSRGNLNICDGPFLLNEHGDLYFLLHKNIVHIILLNLKIKNKKICRKEKNANYDHENNKSTKAFCPCCFKLCDLSPNFIWYCSICSTLSTCQVFFPSVPLVKYVLSYCKM